jgi:hypothetical protein
MTHLRALLGIVALAALPCVLSFPAFLPRQHHALPGLSAAPAPVPKKPRLRDVIEAYGKDAGAVAVNFRHDGKVLAWSSPEDGMRAEALPWLEFVVPPSGGAGRRPPEGGTTNKERLPQAPYRRSAMKPMIPRARRAGMRSCGAPDRVDP